VWPVTTSSREFTFFTYVCIHFYIYWLQAQRMCRNIKFDAAVKKAVQNGNSDIKKSIDCQNTPM